MREIINKEDSHQSISDLIKSGEKFLITRIGLGGESIVSSFILNNQNPPQQAINWFFINAGFYGTNQFYKYSKLYKSGFDNCTLNAYWGMEGFRQYEDFLVPNSKKLIDPSALESFRYDSPWTSNLKGKKILIIHPMKSSIDEQLKRKSEIWGNSEILPDAQWITYQSVQSIGGLGPHKDWYESFEVMCDDIYKMDFDIALLGCGSYGIPLSDFIYTKMNKSAIYIGGGLQLYFGIRGKRWDSDKELIKFYNNYWIRPSEIEKPTYSNLVEGGCYW